MIEHIIHQGGVSAINIILSNIRKETFTDCNLVNRDHVIAYVDGSYNQIQEIYGFGVIINANNNLFEYSGTGYDEDMAKHRNVSGELMGAAYAIEWSLVNGFSSVEIRYDYTGIEKWATKEWRCNNDITKSYKDYVENRSQYIDITFKKVKAHSNDLMNNKADLLSKIGAKIK